MSYETLSLERDGHVATLTLDRPARPIKVTASMSGSKKNRKGDNVPVLFVRDTGSTAGNPRQMHIPLPDPVEIDREGGE